MEITEPEPTDLIHAVRLVESYHQDTLRTLRSHRIGAGITGGYGGLYMLLRQNGYFANLLTSELIAEGLELISQEESLDIQCEMTAAHRFGLSSDRRLADSLDQLSPSVQDIVCGEKFDLIMQHPAYVGHFERQAAYEKRLINHLKSLLPRNG